MNNDRYILSMVSNSDVDGDHGPSLAVVPVDHDYLAKLVRAIEFIKQVDPRPTTVQWQDRSPIWLSWMDLEEYDFFPTLTEQGFALVSRLPEEIQEVLDSNHVHERMVEVELARITISPANAKEINWTAYVTAENNEVSTSGIDLDVLREMTVYESKPVDDAAPDLMVPQVTVEDDLGFGMGR